MSFKHYYFGSTRPYKHNTFIGNVANTIGTRALIASKLGINSSRIKLFEIVGNDIKFCVIGNYTLPQDTFTGGVSGISYYDDRYGLCNILGTHPFRGGSTVTSAVFPKPTFISRQIFQSAGSVRKIRLDNVSSIEVNANFFGISNCEIYLPSLAAVGDPATYTGVFGIISNSIIYINKAMSTNNAGGPDLDMVVLTNNGNTVIYIENIIPPDLIQDVSISNITNTTVDISFSVPYSLNGVSFYEVYINDIYYSRLNTNSGTVSGLQQNKDYKINMKAVDIYYNILHTDNESVFFKTTNI